MLTARKNRKIYKPCVTKTTNLLNKGTIIQCLLINARSIKNKIPDLFEMLSRKKTNIAFLTETWIQENDLSASELSNNQHYQVFFCNRKSADKTRGGGCAILISSNIRAALIFSDSVHNCEIIVIEVHLPKLSLRICLIYRPPDTLLMTLFVYVTYLPHIFMIRMQLY